MPRLAKERIMRTLLLIVGLVCATYANAKTNGTGTFYTGDELLESCEGEKRSAEFGFCIAYIGGVHDMTAFTAQQYLFAKTFSDQIAELVEDSEEYDQELPDRESDFFRSKNFTPAACIPSTAKLGQLMRVVTKYLEEHPEQLHLAAAGLVYNALIEAFPCLDAE
jgi:hypothetical protein